MNTAIHPEYHLATVTCNCGNSFQVGSTLEEIRIEICAACHPFYTGKQNLIDTAGRVDKFKERQKKAVALQAKQSAKPKAAKTRAPAEPTEAEKLKEMKQQLLKQ